MSHYRPYPRLKPSGVPWLSDLPDHWQVAQLGKLSKARCDGPFGSGLKSDHYVPEGIRVVRLQNIGWAAFSGQDAAFISEKHWHDKLNGGHDVNPGDVLIAGLGDDNNPLGRACVAPDDIAPAMVKADCYRFRLHVERLNPDFAALALSATARAECGFLATGATRERLNLGLAASRKLPIPPLEEQAGIVTALSSETARIDALIEKKTRFIGLLKEKRQALITQAVTKGLDPTVPMKDSGVEWIGEIPAHWVIEKLHWQFSVKLGKMLDHKRITGRHPMAYLRNQDVQWGRINSDCLPTMDIKPEEYDRYTAKQGDLLVCEGGDVGRAAIWSGDQIGYQKALHRLRPREQANPKFMYYLLIAAALIIVWSNCLRSLRSQGFQP